MQTVRVGVAGATGYAGQELLAILSRHPRVSLTAAMSSGTGQTELPRLAGVWDGRVEPLSIDQLADVAAVFLALPDPITAEVAPALARGLEQVRGGTPAVISVWLKRLEGDD